jgi:iron complex outermembrane receptor protein
MESTCVRCHEGKRTLLGHARAGAATVAIGTFLALSTPAFAQTAVAAGAQPAADAESDAQEPASEASGLEDIVVTARRQSEQLQDVPVSVSAFTGEMLEQRQVSNLADLGRFTPGLQVTGATSSNFTAYIQLRGQTQPVVLGPLDPPIGIYQNGAFVGSLVGLKGLGLLDIERVEVLRGPQGTLYGRNTTGGAFSYYTNMPTEELGGEASVTVGNLGTYRGHAIVNLPLAEDLASFRLVVAATTDDGWARDVQHNMPLMNVDALMVRGTLRLTPTPDLEVVVLGEVARAHTGGMNWGPLGLIRGSSAALEIALEEGLVPNTPAGRADFMAGRLPAVADQVQQIYNSQIGGINGNIDRVRHTAPPDSELRSETVTAVISYDFGPATLRSTTSYRNVFDSQAGGFDFDGTHWDILGSSYHNPAALAQARQWIDEPPTLIYGFTLFAQDLNLSGQIGSRLTYTAGLFYHHSTSLDSSVTHQLGRFAENPNLVAADTTSESYAGYGQATFELTQGLSITGGLRYTTESKDVLARSRTPSRCNVPPPATLASNCRAEFGFDDSNVSYTAGVDWRPASAFMVYAKADRGFRSGGVNARTSADPASVIPFNSEVVDSYEVGFKSDWFDRRLRFNVAAFHQDYANIQQSVTVAGIGGSPVSVVTNAASARIRGFEGELSARPTENLYLAATVTHLDPMYREYRDPRTGQDFSHLDFPFLSRWAYSLLGQYTARVSGSAVASFTADWNWRSRQNMSPRGGQPSVDRQPGYGLFNVQAGLAFDNGLEFRLYSRNLFNRRYIAMVQDTAAIGTASGGYAEPRTYGLTAIKRF